MEQKTKINAQEGKQDLVILREFNLPLDLLYKAYTEPELLEQWMGTKVVKFDHRDHGYYAFETSHNGQVMFKANGTIHKVVANQEIVRTFEMENSSIGAQLEVLTFESLTETTSKLTMHIIYQSEKHRAEQLKLPFEYGINMAHQKLEETLTNLI